MPRARRAPKGMAKPLSSGQILTDLRKKQWRLGPLIGQGGFGYLYLGSDDVGKDAGNDAAYVIKMEPHSNGPLFVELAFYQRAAKQEMISTWMKSHNLDHLGVPCFVSSGSFEISESKYRFMVMDRYGQDVEKMFLQAGKKFPLHTVFGLGLRIVEALEYLHEQEYVHADIKASNLLTGYGAKMSNMVYLVDYGLAYRYFPNGEHTPYKEDPKRKHDGTIEFTSRDAHKGLAPSRRGDLEVLAYCMLQWIVSKLPWEADLDNKDFVMKEKTNFMNDVDASLKLCLGSHGVPAQLAEYFRYINKLGYSEKPDYVRVKNWFSDALKNAGYPDDRKSVHFADRIPGKRSRHEADMEAVDNGDIKRRKIRKAEKQTYEVSSSPRRETKTASPPKKSPKKRNAKQVQKAILRTKKSSVASKKSSPASKKSSSVEKITKKGASKVTKKGRKAVLSKAAAKSLDLLETKRRVRSKKNITTVDFGQSP